MIINRRKISTYPENGFFVCTYQLGFIDLQYRTRYIANPDAVVQYEKNAKKAPKKPSSSKTKKEKNAKKAPKKAKKIQLSKEELYKEVYGVDWSYADATEIELREKDARIADLESRNYILERERYNFQNELAHVRIDQERKIELLNEYTEELNKLKDDFSKYKNRVREEREQNRKKANEKLVTHLLEVMDNIDRATSLTKPTDKNKELLKGINIINKQLFDILEKEGLEVIDAKSKKFNPQLNNLRNCFACSFLPRI